MAGTASEVSKAKVENRIHVQRVTAVAEKLDAIRLPLFKLRDQEIDEIEARLESLQNMIRQASSRDMIYATDEDEFSSHGNSGT